MRGLVQEYLDLLDAEHQAGDPVMARLFPSASLDDPTIDNDYRDLLGGDLDAHKRATANVVMETLQAEAAGPLDESQQEAWLVLLTDLRLAIGVRLGVTEDTLEAYPNPNDPAQWPLAVFAYLGELQATLVDALQG